METDWFFRCAWKWEIIACECVKATNPHYNADKEQTDRYRENYDDLRNAFNAHHFSLAIGGRFDKSVFAILTQQQEYLFRRKIMYIITFRDSLFLLSILRILAS